MTATITIPPTTTSSTRSVLRTGVLAGLAAAAATEAFAAVVRAAGVHLAVGSIGGSVSDVVEIGPGACAIMVAVCVAAGLALGGALNRWARTPARAWRVIAYALTALSFVPDIFAGATAVSTKVTLIVAHMIAAAIVVPMVGRTLRTSR